MGGGVPADCALVRAETAGRVLRRAWKSGKAVLYPQSGGRRGHPPLIRATLTGEMLSAAPSGGLREALADRPGLVLADIQLADDSSGIDAVKDILAEFSVPVIFITAFPERLLTGERPEPTFLITKPFQRSTVKAAISQALFFDEATAPA